MTSTEEVTAAPLSGTGTSVVFWKTLPAGGVVVPEVRVHTAWAMASLLRSRAVSLMLAVVSQEEW
ncbi:hypothetical protein GCM10020256_73410 [Streptomyces thermocoprophilus]